MWTRAEAPESPENSPLQHPLVPPRRVPCPAASVAWTAALPRRHPSGGLLRSRSPEMILHDLAPTSLRLLAGRTTSGRSSAHAEVKGSRAEKLTLSLLKLQARSVGRGHMLQNLLARSNSNIDMVCPGSRGALASCLRPMRRAVHPLPLAAQWCLRTSTCTPNSRTSVSQRSPACFQLKVDLLMPQLPRMAADGNQRLTAGRVPAQPPSIFQLTPSCRQIHLTSVAAAERSSDPMFELARNGLQVTIRLLQVLAWQLDF